MKSNIIFNIINVLFGAIVGYFVYQLSGENNYTIGLLNIVVGLLTAILLL